MRLTDLEQNLVAAMEEFDVIDSHEHIGPETTRTGQTVDVFNLFNYSRRDIELAGMSAEDLQSLTDHSVPLDERWRRFEPYWERIRWSSYVRAILISVKKFYGFDDINADTYAPISEAMQAANTPGIYQRVLGDACRIRAALTLCAGADVSDDPILTPLVRIPLEAFTHTWGALSATVGKGEELKTLDQYLEGLHKSIAAAKANGSVGIKTVSQAYGPPDRSRAEKAFEDLRTGAVESLSPKDNPIRDYAYDEVCRIAVEEDLPVAVHTGYWGDFRDMHPLHMIPAIQRHPKTRFDIFHLGFPWVRETLMLAKGFPNVWLNLCWTHAISPTIATKALDEALDLLPVNKILGFGADYNALCVEKVYGHLVMAREDMARALSPRIEEGRMTEDQAIGIAGKWLWDNPRELYQLDV